MISFPNAGSIYQSPDLAPNRYNIAVNAEKDIVFTTDEGSQEFRFDSTGALVFPDDTVQTTAYTPGGGGDRLTNGEYSLILDSDGILTIPGNIRKTTDLSIVIGSSVVNFSVEAVDELVPPGGVWRLFFNDSDYPTLGATVQIGDTVTTSWGTPITATIVDIQQDDDWIIHVDQDITAGHNDYDTVTFTPASIKTWTFGQDGDLTLPAGGDILNSNGDSVLGGGSTSYTPDDTDNWNEPTINTISAALDELAARVTALQNFEIDGGNANTPALGELLIDGNGA